MGYPQTFFFYFSLYDKFIEGYIKPHNGYWGFFRGLKQKGHGVDRAPPSETIVENG